MTSITDNDDVFILSTNRPHATFEIEIDGSAPDSESMQPFDLAIFISSPSPPLFLTAETVLSITSTMNPVSEAGGMLSLSLVIEENPPEHYINIRIHIDQIVSNIPAISGMFYNCLYVCVCACVCGV